MDEGQKSWLKRKKEQLDDIDDSACSVGGLAIECGAEFRNGVMVMKPGHPADLCIDIPRLGLKSGTRIKIVAEKGKDLYEVSAWSESKDEMVSVIVERGWLIPVLPREKDPKV